jgi:activator of HSP90 ATPase
MTPAIQQSITLPASPEELFKTFLDSKKHSAMTGMPAKIGTKVGSKWSAFGGSIWGRTLMIVPGKLIVQSWRSSAFKKTDPDSILLVTFSKAPEGGKIDLMHVNVAPQDHKGVTNGWKDYYWKRWRAYLSGKR